MRRASVLRVSCTMVSALLCACFSDSGGGSSDGDGDDGSTTQTDDDGGGDGDGGDDGDGGGTNDGGSGSGDDGGTTGSGSSTGDGGSATDDVDTTGTGDSGTTDAPVLCGDGIAASGEFCPGPYEAVETVNPPFRLAVGLLDGGMDIDVVTAETVDAESHAFVGDGLGGFTRAGGDAFEEPWDVVVGRFDNDTDLDVAYSFSPANRVGVLPGDGTATIFGSRIDTYDVGIQPRALAVGDLDGNGFDDLVVGNYAAGQIQALTAADDGSGGFMVRAPYLLTGGASADPSAIALGRINVDDRLDVVVALENSNQIEVRMGNGSGGFGGATTAPTGLAPGGVATGDLDGDGFGDVVVADTGSETLTVLHGRGDGTFEQPRDVTSGMHPSAVAIADVDGDGLDDVAVAHRGVDRVMVFRSLAMGGFAPPHTLDLTGGTGHFASDVAIADFNRDGAPDIAVASSAVPAGSVTPRFGVFISRP